VCTPGGNKEEAGRVGKLPLKVLAVLALPLVVPLAGSGAVLVRDDGTVHECSLAGSGPLSGTTVADEAFRAGLDGVTWIAGRDQKRIRLRNGSLIRAGAFDEQSLVCEGRLGNLALFAGKSFSTTPGMSIFPLPRGWSSSNRPASCR
jgi:hypothetical protein